MIMDCTSEKPSLNTNLKVQVDGVCTPCTTMYTFTGIHLAYSHI